ncbi:MAG TPA: pyridoxal-dependent decarboxylase [Anaerolineaceae bacterium]|nr:pyridoxal-dependent decarboxylase [Anaerolineaceae bacterium]
MEKEKQVWIEETLDPANWDEMRALAHRMLDDALDTMRNVREGPVWQPIPGEVKASLRQPLPRQPMQTEEVYREFTETILPFPMGNIHPRFWGWVIGTGTPTGVMAEMLAATLNPNVGGAEHVASYVEAQVLDWCKEMVGYPLEASGVLVSGGSVANLIGLVVARNVKAGYDVRRDGMRAAPQPMTIYASKEVHSSAQKNVELMGMGSEALRVIPVDEQYRIDIQVLRDTIHADRQAGMQPICVIGCAGTVNTGAFDDLTALADLCQHEGLWFHVDGAFGALAALAPDLKPMLAGMERADSLAFDMHKWMSMPYDIGCALVRDREAHRRAFSLTPEYLVHSTRGLASGDLWFSDYSLELSRGFRALKAWMTLKEYGVEKFGRIIQQNVDQARYLADLVEEDPALELLAPVPLNTVCFRYRVEGMDEDETNRLNEELLIRLFETGVAAPSYTTLNGHYALRVCNVNHRSRREDFDLLVAEVKRIGEELRRESFV